MATYVTMERPVKFLSINDDYKWIVHPEAASILENLKGDISAVAIAGNAVQYVWC